jgi:hypothetical protein
MLEERLSNQIDLRNLNAEKMNLSFQEVVGSTLETLDILDKSVAKTARELLQLRVSIMIIDPTDSDTIDV